MSPKLLSLLIGITTTLSLHSQTSQKDIYILDKKYYQSKDAVYVPTGSYQDASGKIFSVHAFFMTNEITNKEYREFVDYIASHPDSSVCFFDSKKGDSVLKQQVSFSQIRLNLVDSFAMAKKYQTGSDLYNKYKKYFTDKIYDDFPVVGVSSEGVKYYCFWKTCQEKEKLKKNGMGLINDFRVPTKEEFEYAQSFSTSTTEKPQMEVCKSKSGKADRLGLYNLIGNVDEWLSSVDNTKTSSRQMGFRMVSTFLGK